MKKQHCIFLLLELINQLYIFVKEGLRIEIYSYVHKRYYEILSLFGAAFKGNRRKYLYPEDSNIRGSGGTTRHVSNAHEHCDITCWRQLMLLRLRLSIWKQTEAPQNGLGTGAIGVQMLIVMVIVSYRFSRGSETSCVYPCPFTYANCVSSNASSQICPATTQ